MRPGSSCCQFCICGGYSPHWLLLVSSPSEQQPWADNLYGGWAQHSSPTAVKRKMECYVYPEPCHLKTEGESLGNTFADFRASVRELVRTLHFCQAKPKWTRTGWPSGIWNWPGLPACSGTHSTPMQAQEPIHVRSLWGLLWTLQTPGGIAILIIWKRCTYSKQHLKTASIQ